MTETELRQVYLNTKSVYEKKRKLGTKFVRKHFLKNLFLTVLYLACLKGGLS